MTEDVWLDTLRVAKDHGSLDPLIPPGIDGLLDLPYTIFEAIRLGSIFLGFEELLEEERPPKRIWLDAENLTAWFVDVKRRREDKYSGKGDSGGWDKSIEDPVQNEAAKGLIVGG